MMGRASTVEASSSLQGPTGFWYRLHIDPILLLFLMLVCGGGLIVLYSGADASIGAVEAQAMRLEAI